jgi:hypothetical protein
VSVTDRPGAEEVTIKRYEPLPVRRGAVGGVNVIVWLFLPTGTN